MDYIEVIKIGSVYNFVLLPSVLNKTSLFWISHALVRNMGKVPQMSARQGFHRKCDFIFSGRFIICLGAFL